VHIGNCVENRRGIQEMDVLNVSKAAQKLLKGREIIEGLALESDEGRIRDFLDWKVARLGQERILRS
jgi:hypothetical protein